MIASIAVEDKEEGPEEIIKVEEEIKKEDIIKNPVLEVEAKIDVEDEADLNQTLADTIERIVEDD